MPRLIVASVCATATAAAANNIASDPTSRTSFFFTTAFFLYTDEPYYNSLTIARSPHPPKGGL
jgi:hypothetical protein